MGATAAFEPSSPDVMSWSAIQGWSRVAQNGQVTRVLHFSKQTHAFFAALRGFVR